MKNNISIESQNPSHNSPSRLGFLASLARKCTSGLSDLDPLWQFTVSQLIMNKTSGSMTGKHMLLYTSILAFMVIEELL